MPKETREYMNELLRDLGKASGLTGAALDARGCFALSLDGAVFTVMCRKETEEACLLHTLGPLPQEREERARVSAFLLEQNCFFRGVGAGVLGVFAGEIHYTLRLVPQNLTYADFERMLLFTVDLCADLKRQMNGTKASPSAPEADVTRMVRV
ncbi:MAG: type III secretion system chaperone [Deltaproteobacteria bacterium]|jgi:hypothetical protein|nr:type III secretion system chaperone [Deltaproteobacteria bacterium]